MKMSHAYIALAVLANAVLFSADYETLASSVAFWTFLAVTCHQSWRIGADVYRCTQPVRTYYDIECTTVISHTKPGWYILQFLVLFVVAVQHPVIAPLAWAWFIIASTRLGIHLRAAPF